MRRIIGFISRIIFVGLVAGASIVALAWTRPELLPPWARLRPVTHPAKSAEAEPTPEAPAAPDDGWCAAHGAPESSCPRCAGVAGKPDATCRRPWPIVALKSPEVASEIGLETARVIQKRHAHQLLGNAEIAYNANLYAEVRPRVGGLVHEILTDEGRWEKKGAILAIMDSAEVGTAKARYLGLIPLEELAEQNLTRTVKLVEANAEARKAELDARSAMSKAKADLLDARQVLKNLGFTDAQLKEIVKNQDTSSLLNVVSPIDGTIVERHAVPGEAIVAIHPLFFVADTRVMWAWIDIYEDEIERVNVGQPVTFTISGTIAPVFHGRVDWIDAAVNPATRTIRVRAEMANQNGRLRSNQFGLAAIEVGTPHNAVFVPRAAVQHVGKISVVFLPGGPGRFLPRRIIVKPSDDPEWLEVDWGLEAGQEVVTTGSFLLISELTKLLPAAGG